jgi:hypothetical protein
MSKAHGDVRLTGEASAFIHVMYAESGDQRYDRESRNAPRRRDGCYDMRYAASKFAAAFERGDPWAVSNCLIITP